MDQILCSYCGKSNPEDSVFCESCGKRITNDSDLFLDYNNRCPKCGYINDKGSLFCEGCGVKLENADKSSELYDNAEDNKRCPECGHIVDNESIFCEGCGTRLTNIKTENKISISDARKTAESEPGVIEDSKLSLDSSLKINVGKSISSDTEIHQNENFKPLTGFDE